MAAKIGVQRFNPPVTVESPWPFRLKMNKVAAEVLIPKQSRKILKLNTSSTPLPKNVIKTVAMAKT